MEARDFQRVLRCETQETYNSNGLNYSQPSLYLAGGASLLMNLELLLDLAALLLLMLLLHPLVHDSFFRLLLSSEIQSCYILLSLHSSLIRSTNKYDATRRSKFTSLHLEGGGRKEDSS